ncbi:MAG: hypothetical protein M0C28_42505 [Candidatus Moduliflexus flocculans]|nr:hypothetical protein [Candidatus Moduliflexus flocculans]
MADLVRDARQEGRPAFLEGQRPIQQFVQAYRALLPPRGRPDPGQRAPDDRGDPRPQGRHPAPAAGRDQEERRPDRVPSAEHAPHIGAHGHPSAPGREGRCPQRETG